MIKIQNVHLSKLLSLYAKLLQADFPSTKDALDHIKRSNAIEQAYKVTESAREALVKKYKLDGVNKDDEEANKKANEAYTKVLLEEVELDLVPFDQDIILSINLKPIEILMLKELKLFVEEESKE
jgi:hypothetical protein